MRTIIVALWLTLLVCSAGCTTENETDSLNTWLDEQYESELQRSPMTLAVYGRKEQYDKVDDLSVAARIEWIDWLEGSAADMAERFDYEKLSPQGKNSYDFWAFRADAEGASRPYLYHQYVFDQNRGQHTWPVQFLLNFHEVETESDMIAYIKRVGGLSRGLLQWLEQAREAARRGIRPPRFSYEFVQSESRAIISGYPFDESDGESPVWSDGAAKIATLKAAALIDDVTEEKLREQLRQALLSKMQPAYQQLIVWLESDIVHTSERALGVSALPDGGAYYQERLRYYTHSQMSADEVHELGLREVARIRAEMENIIQTVGFDGTLQDLFTFVREDSQFYYPDTDEGRQAYLAQSRQLLEEMNGRLPDYFGLLPKAELVVSRVEAFREQDGAAQHYRQGTADGTRPGVYYVHLSDMTALNRTDLETTAYHEGNPGHHMQVSIAQELTDIPRFRTQINFSAYAEGWGLYAEYLAKEMGGLQDPYSDFGRLGGEIFRAIRMVVDTGLHARGWSEERAVNYMRENSATPETMIRSEIRRYLVLPGQATSYKAGMLKIQALRAEAEARLGENFDIRGFHDTVLGGGSLPLPILEQAVNSWVNSALSALE